MEKPIGILLMAYGTPRSLDEVEAYYTHIRRGRKPTQEQLNELISRYEAIGGLSPLRKITEAQAQGLEELLNEAGGGYRVYLGMKHSSPFIADTVKKMAEDGITRAVGLVLAPHYSVMSVGTYIQAALEAAQSYPSLHLTFIKNWHVQPKYLQAISTRIKGTLKRFPTDVQDQVRVIFSAHSLPRRILDMGDPYPAQLEETGNEVAKMVPLRHWLYAWQSAGRTPEPWLGPDILDVIREEHSKGNRYLISCPVGFVSDHLEVLYDIDIECQKQSNELGVHLERTPMLNADLDFLQGLKHIIFTHLTGEE
ncbi:ferrochelatase [Microaerobacter geothermalis]|uniref:ferrochelatase n=1 Tax=Microaerobacter geothermalis TaxID=674972 RepID=UPI001F3FA015|nr:ferrochelatase [Microaerobacter geothermalis]MCF6092471.1 ferrochelatase [Microaerobacter geothermalis]